MSTNTISNVVSENEGSKVNEEVPFVLGPDLLLNPLAEVPEADISIQQVAREFNNTEELNANNNDIAFEERPNQNHVENSVAATNAEVTIDGTKSKSSDEWHSWLYFYLW